MSRLARTELLVANLAARQMTSLVIIFDHVNRTPLLGIALHYGQRSVGTKCFDDLGPAVIVIIVNFAQQNASLILLHQIDPTVEIPVAFDFDDLITFYVLDKVWPTVTVGVDRDFVFIATDTPHPLIRPAVASAVRDDSVGTCLAGYECES